MGIPVPSNYLSSGLATGIFVAIALGAGALNVDTSDIKLLLCGMKHASNGSAAVETVYQITGKSDADTYFGQGSELARMCYAALAEGKSNLYAIATDEPSGGTKATVTVTVTGTWSTAGTYYLEIDGDLVGPITIAADDAVGDVASSIAAAVNADGDLWMTASAALGVCTLSRKNKGARGKTGSVYHDKTGLPSGCAIALAGSATLTGMSGGVLPGASSTGAGVDDVTDSLAAIYNTRFHRIAAAQSDATQEAQWENHVNDCAALLEGRPQHVVLGTSGTTSEASSLASSTCNDPRVQLVYQRSSVRTPAENAAAVAAIRSVDEEAYINTGFDGRVSQYMKPQKDTADYLSQPEIRALLAAGVTPVVSADDTAAIYKSVTTKTLNGAVTDLRCDDTNKAVVPDYCADVIKAYWTSVYKPANPVNQDNPRQGEKSPEQGVATPNNWNAEVSALMEDLRKTRGGEPAPILESYTAQAEWHSATESIISLLQVKPARLHHKAGLTVQGVLAQRE